MTTPRLSPRERALVRVSSVLGSGDFPRFRLIFEESRSEAPPTEIEEVLLQSHLFLGFPAAIEALAHWREITGDSAGPVTGARGGNASKGAGDEGVDIRERGEDLCRRIYGSAYEALRENIRALHPDLDRWMVEYGYGSVLGRRELDALSRELAVVGLLAVMDARVQLRSHMRGALNVGASISQVEETLDAAREFMDDRVHKDAVEIWNRVRERASPR